MSLPYVITILVTAGDPDGVRVVEKSNWSGRGVVFSRADLTMAISQGLSSPGVYVLLGEDPDEVFDAQIYVGEGEDVSKRLATHHRDDAKEFWTSTVVFTSKDAALNKAHIRFLEARLIDLAHDAKRARVANVTRPETPPMSAADRAESEGYLAEMLAIFPVLGVAAFDKPGHVEQGRDRYHLSGPEAEGQGEERSEGFLVLKGAKARKTETKSLSASFSRLRSRLVAAGVMLDDGDVYRLTEDYLFKSPSGAAMVLLSRNANGRTEWKDAQGRTLKDRQTAVADSIGGRA